MEEDLNILFQMEDDLNFVLLVCNIVSTQLDGIWKTNTIYLKMEDNLIFFK